MAGTLLAQPVLRAVDATGAAMAGALLQFYLTGTTTPAGAYTSAALSTPLSNPVVADSGGLFPPIYLDPAVTYRVQLKTAAGVLVEDVDPLSIGILEATLAQVNAGAATGVYVSPAKLAAWTGVAVALGYTPVNKAGDTATNLVLSNPAPASKTAGYLGMPVNEQDGSPYTIALSDAGGMVRCNSVAATVYNIPLVSVVPFPVGTTIVFRNAGVGVVTLTPVGNTLLKAGTAAPVTSIALAQGALCTAVMEITNSWVVSGVGIT
jgi:hypothetical protein